MKSARVAFELCRSVLDLDVTALELGVLRLAALIPIQRRVFVAPRHAIVRLSRLQVPLGHAALSFFWRS